MRQMYKVFINNNPLFLVGINVEMIDNQGTLFVRCDSGKMLDVILELAHEGGDFFSQIYLCGEDPEKLFETLKSKCELIDAAGGLVKNEKNEVLMIFRNGKWDLPKGKLEKNETPEIAAVREVEEECGIKKLSISKTLTPTYHTYILNGKIVLKKTFWYEMLCGDNGELVPQIEEGITEVKWMNRIEIDKALKNTFLSIKDVMQGNF